MSWQTIRVSDVLIDARSGFACGEEPSDGVFQFRMNNVTTEGTLNLSKKRRVPATTRNIEAFLVESGDVLFNATNSPELVGKTVFFPGHEEPVVFSNHFLRLRPRPEKLDGRFLARWLQLQFQRRVFQGMCHQWVNQATVGRESLLALTVPLPPLKDQQRIAEILDQAEALRAKRRAALSQLDTLTQAIFIDMFGNPATNSKRIRKEALGELIKLKSGEFLPATEMAETGTFPVFGGNGINGYHDQYMFEGRQIIIGRVGVYCGCVHVSPPRSWVTDNAFYVSEQKTDLEFSYLAYALTYADLNQYASQSGQPLISGSRICPVEILVPPLSLQHEFARRVAAVDELKTIHRASVAEMDALFASLQHRAFRGEL